MALELQRIDPWDGDSSSGITYYGYANAGTQDSEPYWTIKRKIIDNGVLIYQYPFVSGTTLPNTNPAIFTNNVINMKLSGLVWSNRTDYDYR